MPSIKLGVRRSRLPALGCGMLLGLYLSAPAYAAFTPSSAPLLSSAAVTPNVMLLVDNSGSMNNLIRLTAFDQSVVRPQIYYCSTDTSCATTTTPDMEDDGALFNTLKQGDCPTGYYGFSKTSRYRGSSTADYCFRFPDPVGSEGTRIGVRYIAYLMTLVGTSNGKITRDFTDGSIPADYRMNVARTVSANLVTANRALRIGLTVFNPFNTAVSSTDRGPGGNVRYPVADLQATSTTTAAAANTNYNNLINTIKALYGTTSTPLAETYYEITRYFRGMYGYSGYNSPQPAYTSPIQYRCQRNFGVVITDGLPAYDRSFPSKTATGNNRDPDIAASSNGWPNWDNNSANDGDNPNGDGEGDTLYLDDVAKFAYDTDLRNTTSGTAKGSPTGSSTGDLAGEGWDATDFPKQNLLTYTVGFTAANQMLSDAATYGRGKYYQATDAASLTIALTQALNEISSKLGSGGGGTTATTTSYDSNFYYQSLYDPTDWSGIIRSYAIRSDGSVATTLSWTTDTTMKVGNSGGSYETWNTGSNAVVPLAYGNYSTAQRQVIDASLASLSTRKTTGTNLTGNDLVEWVKGTNTAGLKTRTKLLGDVIGSPVVLASATVQTAPDYTTDASYNEYLTAKASRMTNSLLVNANDGLTNVINATTGARRFGYLPSTTLGSLYFVEDPTYIDGTSHRFLNDGSLSVFDAKIGSTWKTIAFGGTGGGGKAFYALQLFDASAGDSLKALWEIRAPDTPTASNAFNDLGYAYAKPEVARLPNGTWAAFISNGFGSNSGVAALYVVNVADGSLIRKIVVDPTETDNGLASVELTVDANNIVQAAYGGDLKGRMWKFDLSSTATTSWGLAFSGKPLFTTPGGSAQPITAQPLVLRNYTSGYMVNFGTGKFLEATDKTSTVTQAFYSVWDAAGGTGNFSQSNLQAQSITGTVTDSGDSYITTSQNNVDYTTKKGWYLPLSYNSTMVGERVITQPLYSHGRILFTTAGVDISDPCSSQGFGRLLEVQSSTGKMLSYPVIDTNGDGLVDSNDKITSGMNYVGGVPTIGSNVTGSVSTETTIIQTSDGKYNDKQGLGGGMKRIMWRQIQ